MRYLRYLFLEVSLAHERILLANFAFSGGPLSEHLGRRNISTGCFIMYVIWTLACALAPNWPAMLVFRFFVGACASAPIAVVSGILADLFNDPVTRGRAMACFMAVSV